MTPFNTLNEDEFEDDDEGNRSLEESTVDNDNEPVEDKLIRVSERLDRAVNELESLLGRIKRQVQDDSLLPPSNEDEENPPSNEDNDEDSPRR